MLEIIQDRRVDHGAGIAELKERFGDFLTTSQSVRDAHGTDNMSRLHSAAPDAVLYVHSTTEVVQAVRLCSKHEIPLVPFGAGTSIDGNTAAVRGGISLDLSRMNSILRVSAEDQDCTVEAGVTRQQLNTYLRDTGLFFPIDACKEATLGGMAGTRASGTNAVRYGTMRENVLALTVVLADGQVVKTANRARKSSAGYDLTRLFVGSAGTLGVITEVTVRLYGIPANLAAAVCAFPTLEAAVNTVIAVIQAGVPMAKIEFMDKVQVDCCNRYSNLGLESAPHLFFEFDGTPTANKEYAETVRELARELGGRDFRWAGTTDERNKLWEARHKVGLAALAMRPGSVGWPTDVTVPISSLARCVTETAKDVEKVSFLGPICGHVGDGNFHVSMILDPANPKEFEEAAWVNDRLIERAIAMGGTCTGEHGVGCAKIPWMEKEYGPEAVQVMRLIKHALDHKNIMNPGKIFYD
jgi:D-lactate dehydrogenase (cytochrome)